MLCKQCGATVPEDGRFCPICGAAAETEPQSRTAPEQPATNAQPTGAQPVAQPGTQPGAQPAAQPGAQPTTNAQPSTQPTAQPGAQPGTNTQPAAQPTAQPGAASVPVAPGIYRSPAAAAFSKMFGSSMFLAICILFSSATGVNFFGSLIFNSSFTFDVLDILLVIACWLLYAASRNVSGGERFGAPLKILSAVATICYILNWIAVGFLALAALVVVVAVSIGDGIVSEILDELEIRGGLGGAEEIIDAEELVGFLLSGGLALIALVLTMVVAVVVVFNIFCFGSFRRTAKSFVNAHKTGVCCFEKIEAASAWVLVYGIITAVGSIGSLSVGSLCGIAMAVGFIMFSVVLRSAAREKIIVDKS